MPHSELHKKRLTKNLVLLAMIMGWCALIWGVTMIKLAQGSGMPDKYREQRQTHQEEIEETWQEYDEQGAEHQKEIDEAEWRWWYSDEAPDIAKEALVGRKQPPPEEPGKEEIEIELEIELELELEIGGALPDDE